MARNTYSVGGPECIPTVPQEDPTAYKKTYPAIKMQMSFIMKTIKASRILQLAEPKPLPEGFVEDRRSVYWVDKLPPQPPTKFNISPRLEKLIASKKPHAKFVPDRPSPVWSVSKGALGCKDRKRSIALSHPKQFNKDFVPDRSPPYNVSKAALQARPSERIRQLAQPKCKRSPLLDIDSKWRCYEPELISRNALNYIASERIEEMALPKPIPKGFEFDRSIYGKKLASGVKFQASERLSELSKPRIRKNLNEDYDPHCISLAARTAVASPRLNSLAQPVARRVQNTASKKQF